jgi:hypothetical protein|eukprot:19819-Pelagococcus_subviridis.AAC.1
MYREQAMRTASAAADALRRESAKMANDLDARRAEEEARILAARKQTEAAAAKHAAAAEQLRAAKLRHAEAAARFEESRKRDAEASAEAGAWAEYSASVKENDEGGAWASVSRGGGGSGSSPRTVRKARRPGNGAAQPQAAR